MHALEPLSLSLSISLSLPPAFKVCKYTCSLDPEDLRRLAKPNQGQTGIPSINHASKRPTLRPMARKNIINLSRDMRFPTMWDQQSIRSACAYAQSDQSLC